MQNLGILAALLLLFAPSLGKPATVEPGHTSDLVSTDEYITPWNISNATLEYIEYTEALVQVSDLPFAPNLSSSCPADPPPGSPNILVAEERRAEFAVEFYRTISENAKRYWLEGQDLLNNNIIHDCASLNVRNLENSTTLDELKKMDPSEALITIYSSILHHTAHAYFIRHQFHNFSNVSCSAAEDENVVSRKSELLALKQKFLACFIRMGASAMGYPQDYNAVLENVLEEKLTVQTLCSRRALRDCQVFRSTVHLLEVVHYYAMRNATDES